MGPVRGERNGSSSHLSPQPPKLNRKRGTLQKGGNCFAPDCDSPLDTLLVGALLVVAAFPSLEPFPSARSPRRVLVVYHLVNNANPSFCATPRAGRR